MSGKTTSDTAEIHGGEIFPLVCVEMHLWSKPWELPFLECVGMEYELPLLATNIESNHGRRCWRKLACTLAVISSREWSPWPMLDLCGVHPSVSSEYEEVVVSYFGICGAGVPKWGSILALCRSLLSEIPQALTWRGCHR